jgi:hypothetical protein
MLVEMREAAVLEAAVLEAAPEAARPAVTDPGAVGMVARNRKSYKRLWNNSPFLDGEL